MIKFKEYIQDGYCVSLAGDSPKGAELLYAEAESLKNTEGTVLLGMYYEKKKNVYAVAYDLRNTVPLFNFLQNPLSAQVFKELLKSFLCLARLCEERNLSMKRVSFEQEHLYFDFAASTLRFVYVPFRLLHKSQRSALDAIADIAERTIFQEQNTKVAAEIVLDYIRRCTIFSWIEFEQFLQTRNILEKERVRTERRFIQEESYNNALFISERKNHGFDFVHQNPQPFNWQAYRLQQETQDKQAIEEPQEQQGASKSQTISGQQEQQPLSERQIISEQRLEVLSSGLDETRILESIQAPVQTAKPSAASMPPKTSNIKPTSFVLIRCNDNKKWKMPEGRYKIGRGTNSNIVLNDIEGVSRNHCLLIVKNTGCTIEDLGSKNGTKVNSVTLFSNKAHPLKDGDRISIAQADFIWKVG